MENEYDAEIREKLTVSQEVKGKQSEENVGDSGTEIDVHGEQFIQDGKPVNVETETQKGSGGQAGLDEKEDSISKPMVATMSAEQDSSASFSKLSRSFKFDRGDTREALPSNQENQDSYQQAMMKYFVSDSNTNFVALSNDEEHGNRKENVLMKLHQTELQKSTNISKLSFEDSHKKQTFNNKETNLAQISNDQVQQKSGKNNMEKISTSKPMIINKIPKTSSYSHFGSTSELLGHRPFKEDREQEILSDHHEMHPQEKSEIKELDIFVLKQRCLGKGKRLTWHIDRIHNRYFHPHTILDNLEHISYPVNILVHEQQLLSRLLSDKLPFIYTENTRPTFFYSEYKVVIIADISAAQHKFKIDCSQKTSQMQYFEKLRISMEIIIKNLFFSIKNQIFTEIQKQNMMRQMPMARSGVEHMKFLQYQYQEPKGLNQQVRSKMSFPCDNTRQVQSDDESIVSDSITSFWYRRNINFPIEEQSESVLDSMYESNQPGYDSTKQSPLKKKVSLQKMSQSAQQKGQNNNTSSFGSSGALTNTLGSVQAAIGSGIPSIGQGMTKPSAAMSTGSNSKANSTKLRMIQNKQKSQLEQVPTFSDYLIPEKGGEHLLKENYEPKVYLSLVIKGIRKTSNGMDAESSTYKTLFLDKQLQYENFEELAKSIDMQLTLIEDELIEDMMYQEINRQQPGTNFNARSPQYTQSLSNQIKKSQIGEMNIIEHGKTILDLMKEDIQPLLVVIGDISNLNISESINNEVGCNWDGGSNRLKQNEAEGDEIFDSIIGLQTKDASIVAIDINSQAKEWADLEHMEHNSDQKKSDFQNDFKNLCFLTQGSYFEFAELVKIDLKCETEFKKNMQQQQAKMSKQKTKEVSEETKSPDVQIAQHLDTQKKYIGLKQSQSLNEINMVASHKYQRPGNLSHMNTSSENKSSNQYFGIEPKKFDLRSDEMRWQWNPFLIQSKLRQKQKEESSKQKMNEPKLEGDTKSLLTNVKNLKAKGYHKSTSMIPLMNSFQRILFSRKIDSKDTQPKELQRIFDFITKNYKSTKVLERLQLNKNCHPNEVKQYSVKTLYLQNELAPRYLKIRIQMNVLKNVNFNRICEFRSKCLFKLHDIKQQPKYNKVYKRIYGERVKYLFWHNSEVILACHIKNIVDDTFPTQIENRRYITRQSAIKGHLISKIKNSKELTIDQKIENHLQYLTSLQTQQFQDPNQNPEIAKVEVVFKIVGQVQTVQKFVKDFGEGQQAPQNLKEKEPRRQDKMHTSQQQSMMKQWLQQKAQMQTKQPVKERTLCQEITEIISEISKSDQTFVVFSEVTNQIRKMFKFISHRQLQMRGKFVISFKQKKQVEQKQAEQSKLNEQTEEQEKDQQPAQPNYGYVRSNSLRAIHMNELDKQHHFVEDDPNIIDIEREQKLKKEKLKKGKHQSKQNHNYQNLSPIQEHMKQNEEFEDLEQYSMMMTQEQVVQLMQENQHNWDMLRQYSHLFNNRDKWCKHFSYRRLDFISPSNYTDITQINELEQIYQKSREHMSNSKDKKADGGAGIGAGAMLDSSMIMKTFLALRKLTTFTLDGQTFIQVFKDKKNKNHNDIYGFCLIKIEWLAFNVLSLHQGFYQTNERSKNQFGKAIKKALVELNLKNDSQSLAGPNQTKINFSCFNKNVVDRIFQIDHDKKQKIVKQRSRDCPDITSFLKEISETNKYDELSKEFLDIKTFNIEMITYLKAEEQIPGHRKSQKNKYEVQLIQMQSSDWQFISDNFQTTKEVQISIFRQRLDEGFIFISSFNKANFNTTHFVKVLEGRKCKFYNAQNLPLSIPRKDSMNSFSSGKMSLKDARYNLRKNSLGRYNPLLLHTPNHYRKNYEKIVEQQAIKKQLQIEKEQTQSILVQYIIKFDENPKVLREQNRKYCLRTLLVMEKESCYFLFNKANAGSSRLNQMQSSEEISKDFKNVETLRDRANSTQSNASHDFSAQSSNPDDELGRKKKNNNIFESMSEKNFFFSLQQYMGQVDNYLKTIVCTFHNILKNSLLKSIQDQRFGGSYDITHQLCYFKNINIQNKRQMKRQNLEKSIKERMQLMRKDQKQFLSKQYPELANDLGTRPLDMLDELRNQHKSEMLGEEDQDDDFDKDLLKIGIDDDAAFQSKNENQQQDDQPENNIFEFDGLLENAQHLLTENLKVPNLEKNQEHDQQIRDQNLAKKITDFYQRLREIFEDFSDFKKQNFEFYAFDLYFKLIAKEMIFIIKVPSQNHFQRLLSKQTVTTIKIEFYIIKKKMINLTKRLKEHKIYKFFTENQEKAASLVGKRRGNGISSRFFQVISENLQGPSWQGQNLPKERLSERMSYGKENQSQSQSLMSAQGDASFMSQQAQAGEDIDEQINQIDQIEDYLFYYDLNQSNHRILFENQVKKIVDNFLLFIQQSYNKVFSETVLMNLNISDMNNDQSYLTKNDFEQTLKSMSESRFVIDVSFLGLLLRCFNKDLSKSKESPEDSQEKQEAEKQSRKQLNAQLGKEVNHVFHQIKSRNFRECQVDSKYLIFSYNDDDLKINIEQPPKFDLNPMMREHQDKQADRKYQDNTYIKNLYGGSDAFQENELQELLIAEKKLKKSQANLFEKTEEGYEIKDTSKMDSINSNLLYHTCKKLIFKVELVIKDSQGNFLIKEPIDDITDIFSEECAFFSKIKQVIEELETKIKHILKQRGILPALINENKSAEKPSLNQEMLINQQLNKNQELAEDKDLGLLRLFSKIETENKQKNESIENLSEDEKLKRYRKIYGVLQQFINDENPNQQLDKLNILNDEKTQQQKFEKDMWQSSIEIHFCIHSTPQHIGLIKDKYIDLLCFKRDNILVNDDDHEDLIRVCNLFNLFNLNRQEVLSTQRTEYFFQNKYQQSHQSNLFQYFDNRQITRSIPFFFKHSYSQNDYRVYRYDDVQRKLIYGILRRSYALLAEVILQNILKHSKYDHVGVALMKKYMGQLLNTQRIYIEYPVLPNHKFRSNLIYQFLINEIKAGHVMKLGSVNDQDEIERQKVTTKLNQSDGFSSTAPCQQIFYLEQNLDFDCDCDGRTGHHSQQPNAIMFLKVTQNSERIEPNKNYDMHVCFIEIVYYSNIWEHGPQCPIKQRQNLLKKLKEVQDRVKIKLILLEIDEKKEMNKQLCIKEPQQVIVTHLGTKNKGTQDAIIIRQDSLDKEPEEDADQSSHSKSKLTTLSMNKSRSNLSYMVGDGGSTFNQGSILGGGSNEVQLSHTNTAKMTNKVSLAPTSLGDSLNQNNQLNMVKSSTHGAGQPSSSKQRQAGSRQNKSKFLRNMEKFNAEIKPEPSKQEIISQRNAQKAKLIELKNQQKQKIPLPEKYEPKKFHEHDFKLSSYIDIGSGIQVISGFLVLSPYCIDDSQDLFIFNDLDLRDQKQQTQLKRKKSTKNDVLCNRQRVNAQRYILRIPKIMHKQDLNPNQMMNVMKRVDAQQQNLIDQQHYNERPASSTMSPVMNFSDIDGVQAASTEAIASRQNKITIEIFGIEPLRDCSIFDKIFEKINTILQNQTIDKFSEKFLKASDSIAGRRKTSTSMFEPEQDMKSVSHPQIQIPFQLSTKDLQYIKEKNQKVYMLFPLSSQVREKYYFLQLLISLLQTFLIPARKQREADQSETASDVNRKKQISNNSAINHSKLNQYQQNQTLSQKGAPLHAQQSLQLGEGHPSLSMRQALQPGHVELRAEQANMNGKQGSIDVDSDQRSQRKGISMSQTAEIQAALAERRHRGSENIQLGPKHMKPMQYNTQSPNPNLINTGISIQDQDADSTPSGTFEHLEFENKSIKRSDAKSEIEASSNIVQEQRYKEIQGYSLKDNSDSLDTKTNPQNDLGPEGLRAYVDSNETMLLYNHKVTENLLTLEMEDLCDQYDAIAQSTSKEISESQHAQRTCLKDIFGHANALLSIDYLQDQAEQELGSSTNVDDLYKLIKKSPINQFVLDSEFYRTKKKYSGATSENLEASSPLKKEKVEWGQQQYPGGAMVMSPVIYEKQQKNEKDQDAIIIKKSMVIRKKEHCLLDIESATKSKEFAKLNTTMEGNNFSLDQEDITKEGDQARPTGLVGGERSSADLCISLDIQGQLNTQIFTDQLTLMANFALSIYHIESSIIKLKQQIIQIFSSANVNQHKFQLFSEFDLTSNLIQKQIRASKINKSCMRCFESQLFQPQVNKAVLKVIALIQSFFQKQNEIKNASFDDSSLLLQIKMLNLTSSQVQRQLMIRLPVTFNLSGKADFKTLVKKNLKKVANIIHQQDLMNQNINMEFSLMFLSAAIHLERKGDHCNAKFFDLTEKQNTYKVGDSLDFLKAFPSFDKEIQPINKFQISNELDSKIGAEEDHNNKLTVLRESMLIINLTSSKLEFLAYNFKNCYVFDLVKQFNMMIEKSHSNVNLRHLQHMQHQVLSFGHPLSQMKHKKSWWNMAFLADHSSKEAQDHAASVKQFYRGQLSILQDIHSKLTKEPENLQTAVKKEKPQIDPKPMQDDNEEDYSNEEVRNQELSYAKYQEQHIEPRNHDQIEQVHNKLVESGPKEEKGEEEGIRMVIPGGRSCFLKECVSIQTLEDPQQYIDQLYTDNSRLRCFNNCQAFDQLTSRLKRYPSVIGQPILPTESAAAAPVPKVESKPSQEKKEQKASKISQIEVQPGFVFKCQDKETGFVDEQLRLLNHKLKRAQELSSLVRLSVCCWQRNIKSHSRTDIQSLRALGVSETEREFLRAVQLQQLVRADQGPIARQGGEKVVHTDGKGELSQSKEQLKKAGEAERSQIEQKRIVEQVLQSSQLVFSQTHQFLVGEQSLTMVEKVLKHLRENLYMTKEIKAFDVLEAKDDLEITKLRSKIYTSLDDYNHQQELENSQVKSMSSNKHHEEAEGVDYLIRYQNNSRLFCHNKVLIEFHMLQRQEYQRKMKKKNMMQQMRPKTTSARLKSVNRSIGRAQTQTNVQDLSSSQMVGARRSIVINNRLMPLVQRYNSNYFMNKNQQNFKTDSVSSSAFVVGDKQTQHSRRLVYRSSKLQRRKALSRINTKMVQNRELLDILAASEDHQDSTELASSHTVRRNYFMRLSGLRSLMICEVVVYIAENQNENTNVIQINAYQLNDLERKIDPFLANELDFERLVARLTRCSRTKKSEDEAPVEMEAQVAKRETEIEANTRVHPVLDKADVRSGRCTQQMKIWVELKRRMRQELQSLLSLQLELRSKINLDIRAYDFYIESIFSKLGDKNTANNSQMPTDAEAPAEDEIRVRPSIDLLDKVLEYFGVCNLCNKYKDKKQDATLFQLSKADNHIETFSLKIEFSNLAINNYQQFTSSLLRILKRRFNYRSEDGAADEAKSPRSVYKLNPVDSDSHLFDRILQLRPGIKNSTFKALSPILFQSGKETSSPNESKTFEPKEASKYMIDLYMLYRLLPGATAQGVSAHELISKCLDQDIKMIKSDLQQAFNICKNIYTKDILWKQFFMLTASEADNSVQDRKKLSREIRNKEEQDNNSYPKGMGNAQIREMLSLSSWINLEQVGEKYRKLLQRNKFDTAAYSYLVSRLGHRSHTQENQAHQADSNDICSFNMQEDQDLQESATSSLKPHLSNVIQPGQGPVASYLGSSSSWSSYSKEMIVFDKKKSNTMLNVRYHIKEEKIQILLFQREHDGAGDNALAISDKERQLVNRVTNILAHHLWKSSICNPNPQVEHFAHIKNIYSSDFSETINIHPAKKFDANANNGDYNDME